MQHNVYYALSVNGPAFHVWRVIEFPYVNQKSDTDPDMWLMSAANTALIVEYACFYSDKSTQAYLNDCHAKDSILEATCFFV